MSNEKRQRNPEKERLHNKRSYEKLKFKLDTDPEFAEKYRERKRNEARRRIERIKEDPSKYRELQERQKVSNDKYQKSEACHLFYKKRYARLKQELDNDPELKAEHLAKERAYYHKRKERLKLNPEQLVIDTKRKQDAQQNFRVNSPEKYKAGYTKQNEQTSKLNRVLKRMKTIELPTDEPIKQEPIEIKQYDKNQQYIDRYGVSYNTLMHYKKLHGFGTIEESVQWYKTSFGIDPSKCSKTKESAWRTMQNAISRLNCVISIESIRDAKINELQQNFYQQYGAM